MFLNMEKEKSPMPDHVTIVSVLPACAIFGALEIGMRIDAYTGTKGWSRICK